MFDAGFSSRQRGHGGMEPPDHTSAGFFQNAVKPNTAEDLHQIGPSRMRLFADAPPLIRASCCARL